MIGIKRVSGLFVGPACLFAVAFCACESVPENCGDGNKLNSATEFCYGGQAYPKCGGSEYDPTVNKCENNVLKNKCGNYYFNPATEFCKSESVYSKCDGEEYNPTSQTCESNVLKGKCGSESYNLATEFCIGGSVHPKCGGKEYDPTTATCENNVLKGKCGGIDYNPATENCNGGVISTITYTLNVSADPAGSGSVSRDPDAESYNAGTLVTVTATAAAGYVFTGWSGASTATANVVQITMNGNNILTANFQQQSVSPPSNTTFVDSRDGKTYKKITIGTQVWMAENLNYDVPTATSDVCYGNSADNCVKYGRLYNWSTAMGGASSSSRSPSGVQGACPVGWHLPSNAEWTTLTDYVGGASTAGKKLKSTNGWNTNPDGIGNGTDQYGFSALPGGSGGSDGNFFGDGDIGRWWSATEIFANYAWSRYMGYAVGDVYRYDNSETYLFSVRCVQD